MEEGKTVAAKLKEVVQDEGHVALIRDAVERVHKITIDATELLLLHLTRCLEEGIQVPEVDQDYFKMVMMEVSHGEGTRSKVDECLSKTKRETMPSFTPVNRSKLCQLLMTQSISMVAAFNTNLHRHMKKRAFRYVRLHLWEEVEGMSKEERKARKLKMMKVASDITRPKGEEMESEVGYHEWIAEQRTKLRLDNLEDWRMEENVKKNQGDMLYASWRMNSELEEEGKKCFSICPLRRQMRPAFCGFDTTGIRDLLSLDRSHGKEVQKEKNEEKKKEAERRRRCQEARKEGIERRVGKFDASIWEEVEEGDSSCLEIQRRYRGWMAVKKVRRMRREKEEKDAKASPPSILKAFKQKVAVEKRENEKEERRRRERKLHLMTMAGLVPSSPFVEEEWSPPPFAEDAVLLIQFRVRRWRKARRMDKKRKKERLTSSKKDIWSNVLCLGKKVKVKKGYTFAGSMRTDGVSIRLLFTKIGEEEGKKKSSKKRKTDVVHVQEDGLPRPGLYTIDQVKHLSRVRQAQIIGADPGKRELLVCVDIDDVDEERMDFKYQKQNSTRYTSSQRRYETLGKRHSELAMKETPENVRASNEEMSKTNSKSSRLQLLVSYFSARRSSLQESVDHFSQLVYRERAWRRHIRGQKSITDFVRRISSMRREDSPMVIAYGSWANVAGRPGAACRGSPPCIGKGLRDKLSKHFIVVSTPEKWTSKTCSACGSICGPCSEVDYFHRQKLLLSSKTEEERKRASHFSVRGLRRCSNESCAVFHNRDYNAATNIGRRLKSLLTTGEDCLPSHSDSVDEELDRLQAVIEDPS